MENGINSIGVWGDSILKGAVTGYSDHLFDVLETENSLSLAAQALDFSLENFSVFGNIVSKSQKRMMRVLGKGTTFDLGIIESGGNDCDYDWNDVCAHPDEPHKMRTPLPEFLRILDEMVNTLRSHKITPLLMTLPPLIPDRWYLQITRGRDEMAIRKLLGGDTFRPYTSQEFFSAKVAQYAQEHGVQIVDMRREMLASPDLRSLMCEDGIHPNKEGYAYMAQVWISELPKIKKEF